MKKIFLVMVMVINLFAVDATMSIVNQGVVLPKIVVQDATTEVSDEALKQKFFKLVVGDLKVGATFEVLDEYITSSYAGNPVSNVMSEKGAQIIYRYALQGSKNSSLKLNVKIIDPKKAQVRYEKVYDISNGEKYPYLAHKSVMDLIDNLGMSPVKWMANSIIFAREVSPMRSEIIIADYTLTYQKTILRDGLNVFPKWANNEQSAFYYTKYNKANLSIYRYDLNSGKNTKIIDGDGMLVASDVSEDGSKLLLTIAPHDQPDIYLYDLRSKNLKQLTDYKGIDVNGNFVDNDSRIVFVSDRLGYPNIYSQGINDKAVEQMVYQGRNNNSVSTYKNYIVYSSREDSIGQFGTRDFNLYLISTQTNYVRQLTSGGKNNFPRFSSDGGSIIFIKDMGGQTAVGIIRVNENKSFQFPLKIGRIQSVDW
ncbi:translocation protein TolB [Campylobacter sputorum subsp. bubulus]|uniref:Translocation protein TolB n=1 Tax=Campylobacter sputorum subsp. sputorum TaxID=32024 RepID=A0A381DJU2_9BACT|nr:Tol-Pal system protein TolB [Campylobacter sputorum]ASM35816.1 Tol-Pal system translocation protein TolB [Campylobacter sputorum aubsp. sputorum RM3237]KAB0581529.1 Tol-Pal system protein TolB [Campylobacter sputorum subsp. sputorum]QEL06006.1 Tol-Pal system translocation protein TolB [Campylobacter sputorum subsp. sputorum]SUX09116.1 translocation protein TolB [Campylobacter sputorum subsp. bubulus]SUX10807.1 translocation protein TolB [Campylobacter sputorum subsp. sputorum]